MKKQIEEPMLRAWCSYRNMEYVEGYVSPLPSENFEAGYALGRKDALAAPIGDRLTDEEKRVAIEAYRKHKPFEDSYYMAGKAVCETLRSIFGAGLFNE